MLPQQILTVEEMLNFIKTKLIGSPKFDLMDRRSHSCFECICATEITGVQHTMKGFRRFFQPHESMPKQIKEKQKLEVDPIFADWIERFVAKSTVRNTSTLMSASEMYGMLEDLLTIKEERKK